MFPLNSAKFHFLYYCGRNSFYCCRAWLRLLHLSILQAFSEPEKTRDEGDIEILDDYSLLHLLRFLSPVERLPLRKVCSRWENVIDRSWIDFATLEMENAEAEDFFEAAESITLRDFRKVLEKCGLFIRKVKLMHPAKRDDFARGILKVGTFVYEIRDFGYSEIFETVKQRCGNVRILTMECLHCKRECRESDSLLHKFVDWVNANQGLERLDIRCGYSCMYVLDLARLPGNLLSLRMQTFPLSGFSKILSNLQEFEILEGLTILSDFRDLDIFLPKLKILYLRYDNPRDQNFASRIISKFGDLEDLKLPSISSDDLIIISNCCPKMKKFYFDDSNQITDEALGNLPEKWPDLEELTIRDNSRIKILPSFKNLKKLVLRDCTKITSGSIKKAFTQMQLLTYLEIYISKRPNHYEMQHLIDFLATGTISRKQNFKLICENQSTLIHTGSKITFYMTCNLSLNFVKNNSVMENESYRIRVESNSKIIPKYKKYWKRTIVLLKKIK